MKYESGSWSAAEAEAGGPHEPLQACQWWQTPRFGIENAIAVGVEEFEFVQPLNYLDARTLQKGLKVQHQDA